VKLDGEVIAKAKIEYYDHTMTKRITENNLTFKYDTMKQAKIEEQITTTFPVQGSK